MTTVIRTRIPLESLSMSQPTARRRSKRIAETYDEEDDGFVFTRASKRTKNAPAKANPPPVTASVPASTTKRGKTVKESKPRDEEDAATVKKPRGRKMSFSTPRLDQDSLDVSKKRKTTRASLGKDGTVQEPSNSRLKVAGDNNVDMVLGDDTQETNGSITDSSRSGTVIALPFSDTPVINRNKEMRKKAGTGVRRSSMGNRGRRASSLIDNGHSAIPHRQVETVEFYKHIEASLIEPRRMKQLLTWTGERCMSSEEKELGDPSRAAANAELLIKQALLKDFNDKSEFSNWFSRADPAPVKVTKAPNPRNSELQQNVTELEERLKLLRAERDQWKSFAKPPPSLPLLTFGEDAEIHPSNIDASLLDPEQAAILAEATSSSALDIRTQATKRLQVLQSSLEFKVDYFTDGVHKLEQYQETVGRVADKILALSATQLEERDRKEREEIGTRDMPIQEVLRSLSRILPEGSNRR